MTDLTEQWKKGELPDGEYYVRTTDGTILIDCYADCWDFLQDEQVEKILCEVPSYESWQKHRQVTAETQIKNCDLEIINKQLKDQLEELNGNMDSVMQTNKALCKKLAQLKELLKECKEVLTLLQGETLWYGRTVDNTIAKIDQVLQEKE